MGLFDFLSSKNSGPEIKDLVWISHAAKMNGALNLINENPDAVLIAWFNHTQNEFQEFLKAKKVSVPEIKIARTISSFMVSGKTVIFLEHYPILSKERNLMIDWKPQIVYVLNALDEPIFEKFGGEKIIDLMKRMGLKENENVENTMITKSIANAQRKLEEKVGVEKQTESAKEWFKKNILL